MIKSFAIGTACFFFTTQFACTKKIDETPDPAPQPNITIKKHLLYFYTATANSGSYSTMQYDSSGRIIAFGSMIDPEYKVFYKNDTIHYVLGPISTFNGEFSRGSWIFLYGPDRKCTKVLQKYMQSWDGADVADNNPFFYIENDGRAALGDSIIYLPTGQIDKIWTAAGSNTYLVSKFNYVDPSQSVPQEIIDYSGVGLDISQYTPVYKTALTYTEIDQPARQQLWFLSFVGISVPVSPTSPATYSSRFLVLVNKSIKKYSFNDFGAPPYVYNSQNFLYQYNSDSTIYDGRCDPDDILFDRLQFKFNIKEF